MHCTTVRTLRHACIARTARRYYIMLRYVIIVRSIGGSVLRRPCRCGAHAAAAIAGAAAAVEVRPAYMQFDATVLLTADAVDACVASAAAEQRLAKHKELGTGSIASS
jgi:hypothetical protein